MEERTVLITKRLRLRAWRTDDEEVLAELADNRVIWLNLRDLFPHPYTLADARARIAAKKDEQPAKNFAIELAGELVGSIAIGPYSDVHRRTGEVGYWVGEPYWGRGIATEAIRAIVPYAFATFGLVRVEAGVYASNIASMRVLEKAGFEREGVLRKSVTKNGALLDSVLYSRIAP
jgi:ribosomal-protein-alanine N-acetyltransferase